MKIGQKLILGFLTIVFLMSAVSHLSMEISQRVLKKSIGESVIRLSRQTMDEIDEEIFSKIELMQIYANGFVLGKAVALSNEEFGQHSNVQNEINAVDKDWKNKKETPFIRSILNNELSKALRKDLEFYNEKHGYVVIAEMFISNIYGAVVGASGRTSDYWQADEDWYQKALTEEFFWITDLEYDESSSVYATDIVIPMKDTEENFIGVFKAVLNIEDAKHVIQRLQSQSHYQTMVPYLVDRNGLVLFSGFDPVQKRQGKDVRLEVFGEDLSSRRSVAEVIQGKDGFLIGKEKGEEFFTAFVHSKGFMDYKGLHWSLLIDFETDEIFRDITGLRKNLLMTSIVTSILAILIGFFVSRSLSVPITQLKDASVELGKGHFDTKIEIKSSDEIGALAASFKKMTVDLKQSRDEVVAAAEAERKKTQELEKAQDASLNIMEDLKRQQTELEKSRISLEQQTRDLKKVNLELDSFVYTASHDLRAPLRGIASFAGILEEDYRDKLGEEGKDYLNEIRKGTQKMNDVIEDLMALSRISRIQNPYDDVDMNELVKSVTERIEFDIHELNVDLKIQKDMPTIYCDRIKMAEVFLNLINNAIKFSSKNKEERPRVEVCYSDQGEFHQFSIRDNGIGIDPKYQDQIFDLFKRLHTDREFEGTGAGLSIVKRVIDEHQGRIWVESQLGQGTTFHFTIPKALKKPKSSGAP